MQLLLSKNKGISAKAPCIYVSLLTLFILLFLALPSSIFCEEKLAWHDTIHPSIGVLHFTYDIENEEITVYSVNRKSIIQNIPAVIRKHGWIEFLDLNSDGYKDIVLYPPVYLDGGPLPSGEVWIYSPEESEFVECEELAFRGLVEKSKQPGCILISARKRLGLQKFTYQAEYWCFNRKSKAWKFEKIIPDYFPD